MKKHASTDWRAVYAEGHNSHSLPYDDVEHIIVIPKYVPAQTYPVLTAIQLPGGHYRTSWVCHFQMPQHAQFRAIRS